MNMRDKRSFFKKSDIIIILVIVALSLIIWVVYNFMFSNKDAKAEIYHNSKLILTIDLDKGEDKVFSIPQYDKVVFHLYKSGNIRFEQSDCPDKVCVNMGELHMVGQSAACLPNGIVLKIVPKKVYRNNDIDIVVGK